MEIDLSYLRRMKKSKYLKFIIDASLLLITRSTCWIVWKERNYTWAKLPRNTTFSLHDSLVFFFSDNELNFKNWWLKTFFCNSQLPCSTFSLLRDDDVLMMSQLELLFWTWDVPNQPSSWLNIFWAIRSSLESLRHAHLILLESSFVKNGQQFGSILSRIRKA